MKKSLAFIPSAIALVAALAAPLSAQAHRGWIMPSSTVLSGDSAWVGFDAGSSNEVFVADHNAMRLNNLTVMAPDGSAVAAEHVMQGQYRSTFDIHLTQPGTYKIANASSGVTASWMLDGVAGRWRGQAAELAANVPAGATDVVTATNSNRLETFVTLGAPTTTVFTPMGQGLEMVPVTHPNDLIAGEAATFQLLKDGQPLADANVTVARGGKRYRDATEEATVKTGADGKFTVTWTEPGMYWLNTNTRAEQADAPPAEGMGGPGAGGPGAGGPGGGGGRGGPPTSSAQYTVVLEVLP